MIVDIYTSLTPAEPAQRYDVLLTRDLVLDTPSDEWKLANEFIVCAGCPERIETLGQVVIRSKPIFTASSRPDLVSRFAKHI